jgi:hypothetical protein
VIVLLEQRVHRPYPGVSFAEMATNCCSSFSRINQCSKWILIRLSPRQDFIKSQTDAYRLGGHLWNIPDPGIAARRHDGSRRYFRAILVSSGISQILPKIPAIQPSINPVPSQIPKVTPYSTPVGSDLVGAGSIPEVLS